ncbi:hypothetical protein PAL_GLEAN10006401 [Pteropus alecto]|uniref:Uncharacterized protein n=1 Tax=Pteropus alecto TaxID=9402 RepID=L5KSG7_PTEAL|nr:hypothetical protein PAL_GLEAN10006401 [Pteropus alecto]
MAGCVGLSCPARPSHRRTPTSCDGLQASDKGIRQPGTTSGTTGCHVTARQHLATETWRGESASVRT